MPRAKDGLKTCTKCKSTFTIDRFDIKNSNFDGLDFWCKDCVREYNKQTAQKRLAHNREKIKSEKGCATKYCMRWKYKKLGLPIPDKYVLPDKSMSRQEVYSKRLDSIRRYKEEHREEIRQKAKVYRQSERGKLASINGQQKRMNIAANVENTFTNADFYFLLEFQENKCACCGAYFSDNNVPCRDHINPLSKGGGLVLENVQLLCRSCNSRKHDKNIQYRKTIPLELYAEVT